jgi:hypothetical protein
MDYEEKVKFARRIVDMCRLLVLEEPEFAELQSLPAEEDDEEEEGCEEKEEEDPYGESTTGGYLEDTDTAYTDISQECEAAADDDYC